MDEHEKEIRIAYLYNMLSYKAVKMRSILVQLEQYAEAQDPEDLEPCLNLLKSAVVLTQEAYDMYIEMKSLENEIAPDPVP